MHLFHDNVAKAQTLQLAAEGLDLTQDINRPAIAKPAVDRLLRTTQFAGTEKAVSDHQQATRSQQTMKTLPINGGWVKPTQANRRLEWATHS